jgi:hypothetical protein
MTPKLGGYPDRKSIEGCERPRTIASAPVMSASFMVGDGISEKPRQTRAEFACYYLRIASSAESG